ncbi:putative transmembrane ascorbate ferrireductase 2 [Nymphaea thermarum]|nr:putative transmembrane ascorbate ferrireductase 2 [Nymphaea thermarum]
MPVKDGPGLGIEVEYVANAAHVFGVIAAILMLVWCLHYRGGLNLNSSDADHIFNVSFQLRPNWSHQVHPVLMFVGFILFSGEVCVRYNDVGIMSTAIMAYKTVREERRKRKLVHLALHLLAGLMGLIGVIAAFKYHGESELPNMYSLHSWLGMATICLFGLQWLIGFVTFWYPGAAILTRTRFRPWHIFSGLTIFIMAICSAETGLVSKAQFLSLTLGDEALMIKMIGLTVLLFGISVGLCVSSNDNDGPL